MLNRSRILASAGGVALAVLGIGALSAGTELMNPISHLSGRWAGLGSVTPAYGPREPFQCVVTYRPDGSNVRQNLRCKSANYKLDAATYLRIEGTRVTGVWQENTTALDGTVAGSVTPAGFDIMLQGRFFQAQMLVEGKDCEQSVKLTPVRADYIRELSASLRKC